MDDKTSDTTLLTTSVTVWLPCATSFDPVTKSSLLFASRRSLVNRGIARRRLVASLIACRLGLPTPRPPDRRTSSRNKSVASSQLIASQPDLRYDGHFIKVIVSRRDAVSRAVAAGRTNIDEVNSSATCIDMISADGTPQRRQ